MARISIKLVIVLALALCFCSAHAKSKMNSETQAIFDKIVSEYVWTTPSACDEYGCRELERLDKLTSYENVCKNFLRESKREVFENSYWQDFRKIKETFPEVKRLAEKQNMALYNAMEEVYYNQFWDDYKERAKTEVPKVYALCKKYRTFDYAACLKKQKEDEEEAARQRAYREKAKKEQEKRDREAAQRRAEKEEQYRRDAQEYMQQRDERMAKLREENRRQGIPAMQSASDFVDWATSLISVYNSAGDKLNILKNGLWMKGEKLSGYAPTVLSWNTGGGILRYRLVDGSHYITLAFLFNEKMVIGNISGSKNNMFFYIK